LKRRFVSLLILALFGSLFSLTASAASKPPTFVSVVMDDKKIWFPDAQAFIDGNGRTLVPVRFVAESLGAKVGWESKTQTVPISRGEQSIKLTINEPVVQVDGKSVTLDTKAILSGGRTFVPLRFVTEVLGGQVDWDKPTDTVFIRTSEDSTAQTDQWGRLIRKTKLPKNASDYPYILADVPNEMYEMDYPHSYPKDSRVSTALYSTITEFNKHNVDIWMGRLKEFGALWLNVDYNTIDDAWVKAVFATKFKAPIRN